MFGKNKTKKEEPKPFSMDIIPEAPKVESIKLVEENKEEVKQDDDEIPSSFSNGDILPLYEKKQIGWKVCKDADKDLWIPATDAATAEILSAIYKE